MCVSSSFIYGSDFLSGIDLFFEKEVKFYNLLWPSIWALVVNTRGFFQISLDTYKAQRTQEFPKHLSCKTNRKIEVNSPIIVLNSNHLLSQFYLQTTQYALVFIHFENFVDKITKSKEIWLSFILQLHMKNTSKAENCKLKDRSPIDLVLRKHKNISKISSELETGWMDKKKFHNKLQTNFFHI